MADKDDKLDIEIGIADKSIKDFEEAIVRGGERLGANVAGGGSSRSSANNPLFEKNKALSNFEKEQLRLQVQYYREKAKEEVRYNNQQIENQKQFNKEKIKKEEEAKGHYRSVFRVLKNTAISNVFAKSLWGAVGFVKDSVSSGLNLNRALNQFSQTLSDKSLANFQNLTQKISMSDAVFNEAVSSYSSWEVLKNRGLDLDDSIFNRMVRISNATNIGMSDLTNSFLEAMYNNNYDKIADLLSSKSTKHLTGDSARSEFSMRTSPKEKLEQLYKLIRAYEATDATKLDKVSSDIESGRRNVVNKFIGGGVKDYDKKLNTIANYKSRIGKFFKSTFEKYKVKKGAFRKALEGASASFSGIDPAIFDYIEPGKEQEFMNILNNFLKQLNVSDVDEDLNPVDKITNVKGLLKSKQFLDSVDDATINELKRIEKMGISYNNNLDKDNILLLTNSINSLSYKLNTSIPPIINNGWNDNMMG